METVGIAVVVFGPLLAFFVLVIKATRKLMPTRAAWGPWRPQHGEPPSETSGDREPRRPPTPSRSGAVAMAVPTSYEDERREVSLHRVESQADAGGDERLAG